MGNQKLYKVMKEKDAIYMKEDFSDEDGIKAAELEGEFAEMNGWEAESDAANLLNGLGVETEYHYTLSLIHISLVPFRQHLTTIRHLWIWRWALWTPLPWM